MQRGSDGDVYGTSQIASSAVVAATINVAPTRPVSDVAVAMVDSCIGVKKIVCRDWLESIASRK